MNPSRHPSAATERRAPTETSIPAALGEQLSRLYDLAQNSTHVFASPLGPVPGARGAQYLPRFVYFGPRSNDASVRLAFLAGFRREELVTTLALLNFVERLTVSPSLGEQLSLTLFPLVNADAGSALGIAGESWEHSTRPEVQLLAADARQRSYHGFVRLEASSEPDDLLGVRLRTADDVTHPAPAVDFISDLELAPYAVRWEHEPAATIVDGPLSLGETFALAPFELTLRLPRHWSLERHQEATTHVLSRFVERYRSFVAYGQNL